MVITMDKDSHLIWEAYEGDDPYADWEHLSVAVMEVLGDYGMYEANLRPSSTVDAGVEEIKELVKRHLAVTDKDHDEVYNELDQMNMEGEEQMAGHYDDPDEQDEEMIINMRLRDMLKAARADVTWEEWTDKYAGEPAKDNVEGPINQAAEDHARRIKDGEDLPDLNFDLPEDSGDVMHLNPPDSADMWKHQKEEEDPDELVKRMQQAILDLEPATDVRELYHDTLNAGGDQEKLDELLDYYQKRDHLSSEEVEYIKTPPPSHTGEGLEDFGFMKPKDEDEDEDEDWEEGDPDAWKR